MLERRRRCRGLLASHLASGSEVAPQASPAPLSSAAQAQTRRPARPRPTGRLARDASPESADELLGLVRVEAGARPIDAAHRQVGDFLGAARTSPRAAGMQRPAGGRTRRTGGLAGRAAGGRRATQHGNGRAQSLRVGVPRIAQHLLACSQFSGSAQIHHHHAGTQDLDHGQLARDERVGEPAPGAKLFEGTRHPRSNDRLRTGAPRADATPLGLLLPARAHDPSGASASDTSPQFDPARLEPRAMTCSDHHTALP